MPAVEDTLVNVEILKNLLKPLPRHAALAVMPGAWRRSLLRCGRRYNERRCLRRASQSPVVLSRLFVLIGN